MDLEDILRKIKGVKEVSVDFVSQTILLDAENEDAVRKVVRAAGRFDKVKVLDGELAAPPKESHFREILQIALSAALFLAGFLLEHFGGKTALVRAFEYSSYILAYLIVGYPVLLSTVKNIVRGKIFDENFLMTVASIGAFCLRDWAEGAAVMLLYQIGELLQGIAVGSSRRSVAALMDLKSENATVLEDGEQRSVKPENLKIGDVVLVKAGEKVPADGVLLSRSASLDTKSLTGEAALREAKRGRRAAVGLYQCGGRFRNEDRARLRGQRRGEDSRFGGKFRFQKGGARKVYH